MSCNERDRNYAKIARTRGPRQRIGPLRAVQPAHGTINIDELLYKNKNKKGQTLAYGTLHALCHVVLYPAAKQYVLTYSKQGDVLVWVSYRVAGPPGSGLGLPYRVLPSPIPLIWQWLALNSTF